MLFNLIFSFCTSESVLGEQTKLHHSAPAKDLSYLQVFFFLFSLTSLLSLSTHSPIQQEVQVVLSGKKNWRFMDEPTSAPETCAEGAFFPLSCSDTFNVFGPLSLYSIIFPSE